MFLTAMAANPLIAKLAHDVAGVDITWTSWAIAAIVPGLASLIITPLVIYKLYPPEIKETPDAAKIATEKLKEMGPFKKIRTLHGHRLFYWCLRCGFSEEA